MTSYNKKFLWIDLEMTGLDPQHDVILEISACLTDENLIPVSQYYGWVIYQPDEILEKMNDWCVTTHTKSGLLDEVSHSTLLLSDVEKNILSLLEMHKNTLFFIAGNSVWQDKLFIARFMPELNKKLHYRIIDVSTIKELVQSWYPENSYAYYQKRSLHRAIDDLKESIKELQHYKKHFFLKSHF